MGILNLKKNKLTDDMPKVPRKVAVKSESKRELKVMAPAMTISTSAIILRPRVTEKATILSQGGREVHVFEVSKFANKFNVSEAIQQLYKVVPVKVAIVKVPAKKAFVRGRVTKGKTGRKAYVYLAKGDKIEII